MSESAQGTEGAAEQAEGAEKKLKEKASDVVIWPFRQLASAWTWISSNAARALFGIIGIVSLIYAGFLVTKDDGTAVVTLVGLALASAFLAVGGANLVGRITRFGPSGVELGPQERHDIDRVLRAAGPPPETFKPYMYEYLPQDPKSPEPWRSKPQLSATQRWYYEVSTDLILHLQHGGLDPTKLPRDDLDRYRDLVLWLAQAALIDQEHVKAFELLKKIEPLKEKSADELLHLGIVYLMTVIDGNVPDSRDYLLRAEGFLEEATRKPPLKADTHWFLGYVRDELGFYEPAVDANRDALRIDPKFGPLANWNMAVSHLKLSSVDTARADLWADTALADLERIVPGPWWAEIFEDSELRPLRDGRHADRFRQLCDERRLEL